MLRQQGMQLGGTQDNISSQNETLPAFPCNTGGVSFTLTDAKTAFRNHLWFGSSISGNETFKCILRGELQQIRKKQEGCPVGASQAFCSPPQPRAPDSQVRWSRDPFLRHSVFLTP